MARQEGALEEVEEWMYEACELHSSSSRYAHRVSQSREIITQILDRVKQPYIAFSCGKDSTVLAHMVLEIDSTVPLRFLSSGETRLVHNVDTILGYFNERGATIQEINIDRVFSEEWKDATWDEQRKAGRGDLEQLNDGDWDCIFMGLRSQESRTRRMSLARHQTPGLPSYSFMYTTGKRKGMIRCCPIARWETIDVGAYLIANNLPWLEWYDYQGFEGRTTARLTGDAIRNNVLAWLKYHSPEKFYVLADRFPEFRWYI